MDKLKEYLHYQDVCKQKYPETWKLIINLDGYTDSQKRGAIAECAYLFEHGVLPEWAMIIVAAEKQADGSVLFVYRDIQKDLQ